MNVGTNGKALSTEDELVAFIRSRGCVLTARDLQRANGRRYPTAGAANRVLNALVKAGLGRWYKQKRTTQGGRPTRIFFLRASDKTPGSTPGVSSDKLIKPIKIHGGKDGLALEIMSRAPPNHRRYVEPYCGGLSVLLARPPGKPELVNDQNGPLTNFFRVLRDPATWAEFCRQAQCIQVSRREWDDAHAHEYSHDPIADALAFFVDCRQSLGARRQQFAPTVRTRSRRGRDDSTSAWLSAVDGLAAVHERLWDVRVENLPGLEVILREDSPDTWMYQDPPYLPQTRSTTGEYGPHEMSEADHRALLEVNLRCQSKITISGYPSDLYDTMLRDWRRIEIPVANHAAGGRKKGREIEVLWMNY
jgi:DNA adenine methylase